VVGVRGAPGPDLELQHQDRPVRQQHRVDAALQPEEVELEGDGPALPAARLDRPRQDLDLTPPRRELRRLGRQAAGHLPRGEGPRDPVGRRRQ